MIPEYRLTAENVRRQTMETLTEHLSLQANGYRCTTEMLMNVILKASAERSSVEAACQDLVGVAASNTVREYLNAALEVSQLREQEAAGFVGRGWIPEYKKNEQSLPSPGRST